MTAFAGLFHRDPTAPAPAGADLQAAMRRDDLPCLGGRATVLAGEQAHVLRADSDGRRLLVTADARIDNRGELLERLGSPATRGLNDAALIGELYLRFGIDCPRHLLGDFAFLIWDEEKNGLFGARDHLGVRPFHYHLSPGLFAAATDAGTLLRMGVDPTLDDSGMADFVAGAFADREISLYRAIRRLPPGHQLLVSGGAVRIDRYWRLEPMADQQDGDVGERFRHIFTEAVRCRTEDRPVGVMLSGGLDSSSIAATASRLGSVTQRGPLPSFSMTFDQSAGWNERPFIEAMLESGNYDPHFLPSDGHDPLAAIDQMLEEQDGPFLTYNGSVSRRLYHAARARGVTLLLDGHGGDEVVSHGFGRLNELAMTGQWRSLWRETAGVAAVFGMTRRAVASPYLDHNRAIRTLRRIWRAMLRPSAFAAPAELSTRLVAPELALRTEVEARQRAIRPSRSAYQTENERHLEILTAPHQPYAFEALDRSASAAGVRLSFPFYDRRLVEFCLAMPSREKLDGGYSRAMLRKAMAGQMPETVRLRRDKFDFTDQLAAGLARHSDRLLADIDAQRDRIGAYVNLDVAREAIAQLNYPSLRGTAQLFPAWRTAVLLHWLSSGQQSRSLASGPTLITKAA